MNIIAENLAIELNKSFILNSVNFHIQPKEHIALVGDNGSGKTTLLKSIVGLKKYQGSLKLGEAEVRNSISIIRQKVGVLFADIDEQFIAPTVEDEIELSVINNPLRKNISAEIMKEFNITHLARKNPFDLSSGEKQRVLLAALIIKHPKCLLLDEPTKELDRKMVSSLIDIIKSLNITILFASHDQEFIHKSASRILKIENGIIINNI